MAGIMSFTFPDSRRTVIESARRIAGRQGFSRFVVEALREKVERDEQREGQPAGDEQQPTAQAS